MEQGFPRALSEVQVGILSHLSTVSGKVDQSPEAISQTRRLGSRIGLIAHKSSPKVRGKMVSHFSLAPRQTNRAYDKK